MNEKIIEEENKPFIPKSNLKAFGLNTQQTLNKVYNDSVFETFDDIEHYYLNDLKSLGLVEHPIGSWRFTQKGKLLWLNSKSFMLKEIAIEAYKYSYIKEAADCFKTNLNINNQELKEKLLSVCPTLDDNGLKNLHSWGEYVSECV